MIIAKSITLSSIFERDNRTYAEGWISTPDRDLQKDEVAPEAFTHSLEDFFLRGAPVSCEHNTDNYPVGHMQKAVLVRDGKVLKSVDHPSDSAEFEAFPDKGSGWYGRVVIEDETPAKKVKSGSMRSFSWIGKAARKETIPGGRWKILEVAPLMEATISAYPVNPRSIMTLAKAHLSHKEFYMEPDQILSLVTELLEKREAEKEAATKKASEEALMKSLLAKVEALEKKNTDLEDEVKKAQTPVREEGTGRKTPTPEEKDPIAYLSKKSLKPEELTPEDKSLIAKLTIGYLTQGMTE